MILHMKNYKIYVLMSMLMLAIFGWGCEENQEIPDLQTVGTSTATIAEITLSNDEPEPGEQITISLYYVNIAEDPATELQVMEQVGSGEFTEVTKLDESSAEISAEITREVSYTVPAVDSATVITLDMLLSSQKEFPQRERASLTVQ